MYRYVGPTSVRSQAENAGTLITSVSDLDAWLTPMRKHGAPSDAVSIVCTFVIDEVGALRVADRASEHVACANGGPVMSAGEMTFAHSVVGSRVEEVSNQSTGYCPEPKSWSSVVAALDAIPLPHPDGFTLVYQFRRCPICGQINLIKDDDYTCAVCEAKLPRQWNVDPESVDAR